MSKFSSIIFFIILYVSLIYVEKEVEKPAVETVKDNDVVVVCSKEYVNIIPEKSIEIPDLVAFDDFLLRS